MIEARIIDAVRTPIGRARGSLARLEVEHLLAPLIQALVQRNALDPAQIDEIIVGNAAGPGGNPARLALLQAGLPASVPGMTVDRQCGSGLEAINLGLRLVQSGAAAMVLAGGVESTSTAPLRARRQTGRPDSEAVFYQRARFAPESIGDPDMGLAAENVARRYAISRERQDEFALHSHRKAVRAWQDGVFAGELIALNCAGREVTRDECPRADTSLQKLSALAPVFAADGTVTAGNACPLNDGAALVLITADPTLAGYPGKSLRLLQSAAAGVDPNYLGLGPVPAIRKVLQRSGLGIQDLDRIEFNEAFATQVLACCDLLGLDAATLNAHGGALALGHPYGASGALLVTRLLHSLQSGERGLATLGIGGGLGLASLFVAL